MNNLTSKDFYRESPYNSDTKTQIWMSQIADGHDNFCNCTGPFAHLLASIFPPGHQDRDLTINQILKRDYQELCRSTGDAAASHGGADSGTAAASTRKEEDEDDYPGEELEELLAAAIEENAR